MDWSEEMNPTERPYVLHGFDVSYFTAKARVGMRYKRLFMEEKRADIRMILERTGMAFIPVVTTPEGELWQDTSEILDRLEERHPSPPLRPAPALLRMVCALVELYADEFALTLAMHTRWGTEDGEAMTRRRFGAMTGSVAQGDRAADQMVKARHAVGATPEAGPAIESHLEALLAALSSHFESHDYLLGARTSLADCALMGPIYAHFYTDLGSRRLLLETALPVVRWIEFCNMPGAEDQGEWVDGEGLSDSLYEVLAVMGRDAAPVLLAMAGAVEDWLDREGEVGKVPERRIGMIEADLRGTQLSRVAQSYSLWMLHRVVDAYRDLGAAGRESVDAALAGTGWEPVMAYAPRHRLAKRGYDLVLT